MRVRKRDLAAGAAALVAALVISGCTPSADGGGSDQADALRLGSTVGPQSWDPAQIGDANYVPYAQAAYDSLILREPDGSLVPMLATEWEFSDDNRTVELTLRDDVTFSDGTEFNADAVKANFEHFATGSGPLATQLIGLESVDVVDDTHVSATFSAPIPDLEYNLSDAAGRMASPAALDDESLATVPVGTGPYVMAESETVQGSTYTFTAREDYWAPQLQKFDRIVFQVYQDQTSMLNALKSGQVDAGNLFGIDIVDEAKASGIEIMQPDVHISWMGLLLFDRAGETIPELGDVRVRQAIAYALDRDAFIKAVQPEGVETDQIFNEGSAAYQDSMTYDYDLEKAKSLMSEAGVDGFTITIPSSGGGLPDATTQTALTEQLGAIGITVEFENVDSSSFIGDLLSGKYPIAFMVLGAVPTDWFVVQSYLTPNSAWNPYKVSDPELQGLIDAIPGQSDDERSESFAAINQFVLDNVWFAPIFWAAENYAVAGPIDVELQTGQNVPSLYNYSPAE